MRGCGSTLAGWGCGLGVLLAIAFGALYWLALPRLDVMLEDSLRRAYLLPPSCTVLVERGSLLDTLEGQVQRVYIESPESKLGSLVATDLRLLAEGVDFDMVKTLASRAAVLDQVTHGEITFGIPETALQELWADQLRSQGLTGAAVDVTGDGVSLRGTADLKLAQVPVAVSGKFKAVDGQRVKLQLGKFALSGMELPSGDLQTALAALAPEIDLSQFKMDVEIDEIKHIDGAVLVSARTRSLADRFQDDQAQAEDHNGESPSTAGQRLKLPKLDELVQLFIDQEPAAGPDRQAGDGAGGSDSASPVDGAQENSQHTGNGHG